MKFCKDCKHYRSELVVRENGWDGRNRIAEARPACDAMSRDPVHGDLITAMDCRVARNDNPGYCGIDARFFEPKQGTSAGGGNG